MGEHAAVEIGPDLALDEAGDGRPGGTRTREEGRGVLSNDSVEQGRLGLVACVANRGRRAGTQGASDPSRNPRAEPDIQHSQSSPDLLGRPLRSASCDRDRSFTHGS